jgi:hypothetical protein
MVLMHGELTMFKRPTRLQADGAFFVALCGDRLVVKDAGGTSRKRQFEPGSPRQLSGTVSVAAVTALSSTSGPDPSVSNRSS